MAAELAAFDGAVLAGGASPRMGRDKALIEIDGVAMVTIAVEALRAAGAADVWVVGGDRGAIEALGHRWVPDLHPGEGPLGGVITAKNAREVRAKYVLEAANGPIDAEADEILEGRDITVIPDIYANAGGVTVSYFEWVQNLQNFSWDETRINDELGKVMTTAHGKIRDIMRAHGISMRKAAFVLAIREVKLATETRGIE